MIIDRILIEPSNVGWLIQFSRQSFSNFFRGEDHAYDPVTRHYIISNWNWQMGKKYIDALLAYRAAGGKLDTQANNDLEALAVWMKTCTKTAGQYFTQSPIPEVGIYFVETPDF